MLKDTLTADLKDAMRQKDKVRLTAIRMVQTAITEKEKSGTGVVSEEDVVAILAKQAKQRRDSIAQFESAGRDDLAAQEAAELEIIEAYLPAQATDEEIQAVVDAVVARTGASSMKDMGKVMGPAMGQLKGVAEGGRVQAAVRKALGAA